MELTATEKEVIGLKAATSSIDSMVNRGLLSVPDGPGAIEVRFTSSIAQQLFGILLLDFLEPVKAALTGKAGNCLDVLAHICESPQFDELKIIEFVRDPVRELQDWLQFEVTIDTWLPTIDARFELPIRRKEFVYICGNISKHNFTRLTGVAGRLVEVLKTVDVEIAEMASVPRVG